MATTDTVATTTVPEAATTTTATTTTALSRRRPPQAQRRRRSSSKNAAPVGGIQRATVKKGDHVALVVYSDVDDEVHVHGYNFATDVDPTVVGNIDFVADAPGRFEVELEDRGVKIAEPHRDPLSSVGRPDSHAGRPRFRPRSGVVGEA